MSGAVESTHSFFPNSALSQTYMLQCALKFLACGSVKVAFGKYVLLRSMSDSCGAGVELESSAWG